jgi:hypothetical protein
MATIDDVRNAAKEARYPAANYPAPQETKVVRIPANLTVTEYFDLTLQTEAEATSVSSSLAGRLTITGSVVGGGWNDASASAAGVPVGGMYYTNTPTTGSIKVRLA